MKQLLSVTVIGALFLCGCVSKPKPDMMSSSPTADQVQQIRESFKTSFPAAKVGTVTAVLDNEPYAMVGNIDTGDLRNGQIVSFLDATQQVIANGQIVKVEDSSVAVQFDAGVRRPQVGDVAVKF
ncbi:MAG: hypothetical protein ACTHLZ_18030 [Tepidisphaeraceae bacterium]